MISMVIASAVTMAAMQASINAPRSAFVACLQEARTKALADKLTPDGYVAFVKETCAAKQSGLHGALVAFDTKNGVGRKRASDDANLQIDDYYASEAEVYQFKLKAAAPAQ